mmetsp:Transcript_17150/g.22321  ORF Transcript_17150/g.22321 Transcript_17150/m.22321 type:complete len:86 (-) Transcript_17150:723-980(-)
MSSDSPAASEASATATVGQSPVSPVVLDVSADTSMEGIAGPSSGSNALVLTEEQQQQIGALVETIKKESRTVLFTGYWARKSGCF